MENTDLFGDLNGAAQLLRSDTQIEVAAQKLPAQGVAIQRSGNQYVQALSVQNPRDLRQVTKDLMIEAELLGESAYYSWSVKDKETGRSELIEGPSIELAIAATRSWRNCAVEHEPVQETPTAFFFTARFVDIERGVVMTRPFRQDRGWKVYGRMDDFRKEDIRFQIGASKAARNVILNYIPKSIISLAMEKAKAGVRSKIEDYIKKNSLAAAQKFVVAELGKVGVTEKRILAAIKRATINAIDVDDMVRLRGDLKAIQEGAEFAETLFPEIQDESKTEGQATQTAASKTETIKEQLKLKAEESPKN